MRRRRLGDGEFPAIGAVLREQRPFLEKEALTSGEDLLKLILQDFYFVIGKRFRHQGALLPPLLNEGRLVAADDQALGARLQQNIEHLFDVTHIPDILNTFTLLTYSMRRSWMKGRKKRSPLKKSTGRE